MKEAWNSSDSFLVVNDRMTEAGLSAYWDAVDASLKFNAKRRDLYLAKKFGSILCKGGATACPECIRGYITRKKRKRSQGT